MYGLGLLDKLQQLVQCAYIYNIDKNIMFSLCKKKQSHRCSDDSLVCYETLSDIESFEDALSDDEYMQNWSPDNHEAMLRSSKKRRARRRQRYATARRAALRSIQVVAYDDNCLSDTALSDDDC